MSLANDNLRDDPDTERWCVDFLNALRSRHAEIRAQSDYRRRGDNLRDDPNTERWCVDFLNALRSRYAEIRDQSDHTRRGDKTMGLRNLIDRVYDELAE